jgi:hypothetical protein
MFQRRARRAATQFPRTTAVLALVLACALGCAGPLAAAGAGARPLLRAGAAAQPAGLAAATLAECVDAVGAGGRYATFAAEMTALPGSARMEIRIEVQERLPGDAGFRGVTAPGLGAWRLSDENVGAYRYLRQVTNLATSAVYRASVHFRWLNARGLIVRRAERLSPRCAEPSLVASGPGGPAV